MMDEQQPGHVWLSRLQGEWTSESHADMGPDQSPCVTRGRERVIGLGGLWVVCEGDAQTPDGSPMQSRMTLGYDPEQQCFVGTWVCSVMSRIWSYTGYLDGSERELVLDCEGPSFKGDGTTARYQDVIAWVSDAERTLTSRVLQDDGSWQVFMTATYRRAA